MPIIHFNSLTLTNFRTPYFDVMNATMHQNFENVNMRVLWIYRNQMPETKKGKSWQRQGNLSFWHKNIAKIIIK